jgi:hypothetical protein
VTVRVPPKGIISFFNSNGATHVIADVVGYYDTVRKGDAGRYVGVAPARILDTRLFNAPLGANRCGAPVDLNGLCRRSRRRRHLQLSRHHTCDQRRVGYFT